MSTVACVRVSCPHCLQSFRAGTIRLTSGQALECPHCGRQFHLERKDSAQNRWLLSDASAAQTARMLRLSAMREDWS